MHNLPDAPEPLARRSFLGLTLATPLAAAASLVGAAVPLPAESAAAAAAEPVPPPRGYHRSDHIDTYYASLRY